MKIPQPAPDWKGILAHKEVRIVELVEELAPLLKQANDDYLYWDRFKYLPFPAGVRPEEAWAALKLGRSLARTRTIPLTDSSGSAYHFHVPDKDYRILHDLDLDVNGQGGHGQTSLGSEEQQRYIVHALMEEAITSSQLEGAATTRAVAREMLRSGRRPRDHAEKMIFNNYTTIRLVQDYADRPLSASLLREFHDLITEDTLDDPSLVGRFRTTEDGDIFIRDENGQLLYTPPAATVVEQSVDDLCAFANDDSQEEFVHPVVKAIVLHFWLAVLHPFIDGNGRTARTLFYWYLMKKKYRLVEFLSISREVKTAANQYYRAFLYAEIDEADMTYFIHFHLRVLQRAVDEMKRYVFEKQRASKEIADFLTKQPNLNFRQRALLGHALEHPQTVFTIQGHMVSHGVVYQTARADLLALVEKDLLTMNKSGKRFVFTAVPGLNTKIL